MEDNRPNPDELLASLRQEEESEQKGKLKIFFGMAPGVGKTYTMLQAAQADAAKGVQVVVGYAETHRRAETEALLEGLEIVPRKKIEYKGTTLEEADLDTILAMHPYLVLMDELAHTNAPGSRHLKRYQDVRELLDNGINVYTTLNVQHLESCADTVAQIAGITVRETLPDEIFDKADEVELIDLTPDELFDRLAEGKVYTPERSKEAVKNFFRKGNITALREMALRVVAGRVDRQLKTYMQQKRIQGPWKSGLHLLALIGPSPTSMQLIRRTKNMADALDADWMALHVETAQSSGEKEKRQLALNINLVRQLDGEVITTSGNDLVQAALSVARKENITHIIVGKPWRGNRLFPVFTRKNFVNRLIGESGNIDVYMFGAEETPVGKRKRRIVFPEFTSKLGEYAVAAMAVVIAAVLCVPLVGKTGYQSVSFILLMVLTGLAGFLHIGPILLAATLGALSWNFFFIPPMYTFHIKNPTDILTFLMFYTIALLGGILTFRVRKQERLAVSREERTNALFHLTKQLAAAANVKDVIVVGTVDIKKYFGVDAFFLLRDGSGRLTDKKHLPEGFAFSEAEMGIADWVFKHSRPAGRFTETLPSGEYTYYPLKGSRTRPGVAAVKQNEAFAGETAIFWDTFLTQISSAIEHRYLGQAARKTALLNESDRLYKTMFDSISSELKIPVTAIMDASDRLLADGRAQSGIAQLYGEISKASRRLNRLINNLLSMSRIESGRLAVHLDWCDIRDPVRRVAESLAEELRPFRFDIVVPESMPLVKLDSELMEQVLHHLVYNSCRYAPAASTIRMKAFYDSNRLVLQEMDRGPGFASDVLPHVFDKFFRTADEKEGLSEGLGLGLAIVKGFVEAHKGTVSAENRKNGGARFTIQIPTEISYGNETTGLMK